MTSNRLVVAGADTHSETHHVAVLDAATGQLLADRQFPATHAGYRAILAFIHGLGQLLRFGVEGTNSYGAGLTRHLREADVEVCEAIRPNRATRRLRGKSDPVDAITAAQVTLSGDDLPIPKSSDGPVESIRLLAMVRDSAVKARANVLRQIGMILVSAPTAQREKLQKLKEKALLETLGPLVRAVRSMASQRPPRPRCGAWHDGTLTSPRRSVRPPISSASSSSTSTPPC